MVSSGSRDRETTPTGRPGATRRPGRRGLVARMATCLGLALAGAGCETGPCPATPADAAAAVDAVAPLDAARSDSSLLRVTLTDGAVRVGERIATYDHSRWWDAPGPELTHALFTPDRFAAWPADRSLVFVSSFDVAALEALPWPADRMSYQALLRGQGILLHRLPLDGVTHVFTAHDGYHLDENGYGDFAWDLVRSDADGARFTGDGSRNEDYLVWDAPVYLPTAGLVIEVVRDATDNDPGFYAPAAVNNLVGVHLGGSFYLYLLHLRQGSIPAEVADGAQLPAGAFLGNVGNAGVTLEPHLHVALVWYDEAASPPRSYGVPCEMRDVWIAPSPLGPAELHELGDPSTGTWIASEPF